MCLGIPGQVIQRLEGYGDSWRWSTYQVRSARSTSECLTLISKTTSPQVIGY